MAEHETNHDVVLRKEAKCRGLTFYYTGKRCKSGHLSLRRTINGACLECVKAYRASDRWLSLRVGQARRHYQKNKDHILNHSRRYYLKNKDRVSLRVQEYRKKKRDKLRADNKKWREKNTEWLRGEKKRWREENRELCRTLHRNRKARKRNNGGSHTADDIAAIFQMQRGKCAYCRTKLGADRHVDHIVPLISGGSNGAPNLQILCPKCNLGKGARDPIDHARTLGMLL